MITAPLASTNPHPGVMTTSPPTAPEQQPFQPSPAERCNRRRQGRGHKRVGRNSIGAESAAGIKPVPTDPKHSSSDHAKDHRVRRHDLFAETEPGTEEKAKKQG